MRKKIKIGVVGAGPFSSDFIRLFKLHPDVEEVALADLDPEKLKPQEPELRSKFKERREKRKEKKNAKKLAEKKEK